MKSLCTIIIFLCSFHSYAQDQFSRNQVLEDMDFLKNSLEEAHYNLYAYTSKQAFDSNYISVRESITQDSLSLLEAISALQQVVSKANNGHTGIDFPGQAYIKYAKAGGKVFPLEIAFEYDKPLVRKSWSKNDSIKIGSEVLSINGISIETICSKIHPLISAERPYFKNAKIELYSFPRYYWQVFGLQNNFEIEVRSNGLIKKHSLKAISAIEDYEMKRTEVISSEREMKFIDTIAYLNPGGFGGDEEQYQTFIDSTFAEINTRQSQSLIIDLRNNPGGNDSFSDYLVSYIADKPFKWNSSFMLKTSAFLKKHIRQNNDTTKVYWQKALAQEDGAIYPHHFEEYQPKPKEKRFDGKVYILINRQSHSQSAVTAAQIQDYGFGTIVGEETGDYPSLYASIFHYPLPNTKIMVNVAKGYMVRVNKSRKEEGVIPDVFIKDYLLDEDDEVLDGVLKLIERKN